MHWLAVALFASILLLSGCSDVGREPPVDLIDNEKPSLMVPAEASRFKLNISEGLFMVPVESAEAFRISVMGGVPERDGSRTGSLGLLLVPEITVSERKCEPLNSSVYSFFRQLPGDETNIYSKGSRELEAGVYRIYAFSDTNAQVIIGFNWQGLNDRPDSIEWNATKRAGEVHVMSPSVQSSALPFSHTTEAHQSIEANGLTVALSLFSLAPLVAADVKTDTVFTAQRGPDCANSGEEGNVCVLGSTIDGCDLALLNHAFLREPGNYTWQARFESTVSTLEEPKIRLMLLEFFEDPFNPN